MEGRATRGMDKIGYRHIKGDMSQCSNNRTIALLSHVGKVLMMVLLERLKGIYQKSKLDSETAEVLCTRS